jgi:hypothetical protein
MSVSWRNIAACVGVGLLAASSASVGLAQTTCCSPVPAVTPSPSNGCCTPPRNIIVNVPGLNVGGASVNVGAVSSSVAVAGVSTTLSSGVVVSGASSSGSSIIYGGGGGYSYAPPAASSIRNLNVEGGFDVKTVTEDYCVDKKTEQRSLRPVQAVCLDDKNTPHPASRLDDDTKVERDFSGEVYRCLAGSHMQVTLGEMKDGFPSFAAGETFSCAKGESLWHAPGGKLECRAQKVERNCNERSLLRKYGPGVKQIEVISSKSICEPAKRTKEIKVPRQSAVGDLQLDGGVGGGY